MSARLIYVVGPSGAGKDSLLSWLREQSPNQTFFHWTRRTINRSQTNDSSAEAHESVSTEEFEKMLIEDTFAMHWSANGHFYGVRKSEMVHLEDKDSTVIVNGSRAHMHIAAKQYPCMMVLHITASREVLRDRLLRRGRETQDAIDARLNRVIDFSVPKGCVLIEIHNDTTLDSAGRSLLKSLQMHHLWS